MGLSAASGSGRPEVVVEPVMDVNRHGTLSVGWS